MPNIKSAKKRVKVTKIKAMQNQTAKTELKTVIKKFESAVESGDKTVAEATHKVAVKAVDQACAKRLLHKNNAANKKSAMALKLNNLQ